MKDNKIKYYLGKYNNLVYKVVGGKVFLINENGKLFQSRSSIENILDNIGNGWVEINSKIRAG